jgi:peptidoglycan/xylan/chitin deacetylase (PgdA/CDA1 family)
MKVALTFDLCEQPHEVAGYDGPIIDFLRETKTRATFFAGGKWIVTHTRRARELIADPSFEVGNHTWEHRNLRWVRGERLLNEINAPQIAYGEVYAELVRQQCVAPDRGHKVQGLDVQPSVPQLFRFPFGACDVESLRAVAEAGLIAIQWDLSTGDPMRSLSAAHMADGVVRSVRPGSIVLFHANGRGWQTAQALRLIIPALRRRGYELVTVSDLLNTKGARPVFSQTCYDARPGDTNRYDNMARRLEVVYDAFDAKYGSRAPQNRQKVDDPVLVSPPQPTGPRGDGLGQVLGGDERNPLGR